jgi:hypothetical protein
MTTITKPKNLSVAAHIHSETVDSFYKIFLQWCDTMEFYRFGILAAIVAVQGCILVPITLLLSLYVNIGISDITLLAVTVSTMAVMVTNMALTPMRVIIIVFVLNLIIHATLIACYLTVLLRG